MLATKSHIHILSSKNCSPLATPLILKNNYIDNRTWTSMQSIFYKIVECLLITFKLFCLVLEDSYKDFINVFVTELISWGFIFLSLRWKTVYIPTIQRGSAMAVTHKSAMAKFRMNSFPDLFIPLITAETRRIRAFPHVPTRRAIPMMTI